MNFTLPFTEETLDEMSGKTVVLSENHRNEDRFFQFQVMPVSVGGTVSGGHFEVSDGVLRLCDQQGLFCEFDGVETRNGVVFGVGRSARTASRDGFDRITIHEQRLLQPGDFGICVSSNADYAKTTLPRVLGSLRKAGMDMSRVVAIVGGDKDGEEKIEEATVVHRSDEKTVFGGLLGVKGGIPYWLLLHDTCEVEQNFLEMVSNVDVGLRPDVVWLKDPKVDKGMMGYYSDLFIQRLGSDLMGTVDQLRSVIGQRARVITSLADDTVEIAVRDVYGTGRKRRVEKMARAGIRKFRSVRGKGL